MSRFIGTVLAVVVAVCGGSPLPVGAAELPPLPPVRPAKVSPRSFFVEAKHGELVLTVPESWDHSVRCPRPGFPPTIEFATGGGRRFSMQVTSLWAKEGKANPTAAQLRELADARLKGMLPTSKETAASLQEIKGEHATGYAFTVTDKAPKPGEFECLTGAVVQTGNLLLSVTMLHHQKEAPERAAGLEALKSAAQRLRPAGDGGPAVLRVTTPVAKGGDLLLGGGGLVVMNERFSAARRTHEVMAVNPENGMIASVFMEPAVRPGDATVVRGVYWGRAQQSPLTKRDVKLAKAGEFATVEYVVPEGGEQKNVNVYAARDGVWVDVHFSKVEFTAKDQPLFHAAVAGVRFDRPAAATKPTAARP